MATTTTADAWERRAIQALSRADIASSHLDAHLMLAYVLERPKNWLRAHGDTELTLSQIKKLDDLLAQRLQRVPLAYLTGRKEFYGRDFHVTPDVLIPRPESETAVELLKQYFQGQALEKDSRGRLLDVGTGSGALGITAALEFPQLDVTLSDISPGALRIAAQNAQSLGAAVHTAESDLLECWADHAQPSFDLIIANLPYVDRAWQRSPETDHEPPLALFADDSGKALINRLLEQAPRVLKPTGHLLIEADPEQHDALITTAAECGFSLTTRREYWLVF